MSCCYQDPELKIGKGRAIVMFLVGAFDSLIFAGAVFGWPQLVRSLKMDNVYGHLCDDVNTAAGDGIDQHKPAEQGSLYNNSRCAALNITQVYETGAKAGVEQCDAQDQMFALLFTLAVLCYGVPSMAVGYLLHHAGLWATRISAGIMLCIGFIFLGVTTQDEPHWLFPAIIFLALGGNQIRMSGLQLADLFPAYKATAITVLSGMYSSSASIFFIFQIGEDYSIERPVICWCFAGLATCIILMTFIMPVHHVPHDDSYDETKQSNKSLYSEDISPLTETGALKPWIPEGKALNSHQNGRSKLNQLNDLSLAKSVFSLSSILLQLWMLTNLLALNIYQMTYYYWITSVACSSEEAETFTVGYSLASFMCMFIAPVFGVLVDHLVGKARQRGTSFIERRVKEIQSNIVPILLTSVATFCMYLCLLFFQPLGVYFSLAFMAMSRPCIFSVSTAYIRIRFPVEHFNRLVGIHFTITSMLLLLQFPQFQWSQSMYVAAHTTILVMIAVSMLNPLHLMVKRCFIKNIGSPSHVRLALPA